MNPLKTQTKIDLEKFHLQILEKMNSWDCSYLDALDMSPFSPEIREALRDNWKKQYDMGGSTASSLFCRE